MEHTTEKLIIHNQSNLTPEQYLIGLIEVIKLGRISGESYCFVTTFQSGYRIISMRNAKSDKFIIQDTHDSSQQELELKNRCE